MSSKPHSCAAERAAIRRTMRARRRELGGEERARFDAAICRSLESAAPFRRARHVAVYLAFDGEPAVDTLAAAALRAGKTVHVPIIEDDEMSFAPLLTGVDLVRNRFGILEPDSRIRFDPRGLDLVVTPLVAYDAGGTRIGVGRAYYDRCFRFLRHRRRWQRPKLLGAGYSFQRVEDAWRNEWDIPLWGIVTELGLTRFPEN